MNTDKTFLETVDALAAAMRDAAVHLASALKTTPPSHGAHGVLHRLERICYDTSVQFDLLLSPEVRAKLQNIDAEK
jgi:hypothetical protein